MPSGQTVPASAGGVTAGKIVINSARASAVEICDTVTHDTQLRNVADHGAGATFF